MRKIIVTEFMSLDGIVESPMWSLPYWNDEIAAFKGTEQEGTDAMLLGRITYEGFAAAWPGRTEDGAEYMNNTPKYVATRTLKSLDWSNSHIMQGDVAEFVRKLKQEEGKDMLVYGSVQLTHTLLKAGLVDQINIIQYPIVVGSGLSLFGGYGQEYKLKLVESRPTTSGAIILIYKPE